MEGILSLTARSTRRREKKDTKRYLGGGVANDGWLIDGRFAHLLGKGYQSCSTLDNATL